MTDIDNIVQAGTTQFNLEEVKMLFNHDVKVDVSGININAKQGEILNLPRWVADVLETEKHGQIEDTDMVVELKQALVKENVKGEFEMAILEPHFYIKLRAYMKKLTDAEKDKYGSLLNTLVRKRQGKIIRLADSSKLTADIAQKLTIEEKAFFDTIHQNSKNFKEKILGGIGEVEEEEEEEEKKEEIEIQNE